jgi:uncharacterized protein (UPF0212 family)
LAVLHTFDATLSFTVGNVNSILKLYPIGNVLENLDVTTYLWASIALTFVLFGITCVIAFHDPIEILINKILSNVEAEENPTDHTIESSLCTLEMMNSTLTSNGIALHAVKDNTSALKADLGQLVTRLEKLENDFKRLKTCPSCGKGISPDFRLCPYCGELLYARVFVNKSPLPEIRSRQP